MIRLTVLLFADLAEAAGFQRIEIEVPEGSTVAEVMDVLAAQYEVIATARPTLAYAVDEVFQPAETPLADGATLALIPPVSGG